jgi:hypothetical protein
MGNYQFTPEEIVKLRELLEVAETVKAEAEYKMALRLVLSTWKRVVIGLAAILGAILLLREQIRSLWHWFIGG